MSSEHFVSELAISASSDGVELVAIALGVDQMIFGEEVDHWVECSQHSQCQRDVDFLISFLGIRDE